MAWVFTLWLVVVSFFRDLQVIEAKNATCDDFKKMITMS
jgi:hypothetical protein